MEILTYKELRSKNELLPLMDHAFGWPFNPITFEKSVKTDPRLNQGAVCFCAVEDERVIACVGVMDLATRTFDGKVESVGGVYGVATLPSHARKGVSTALMNKAHEYFKERQFRFSFLWTSRSLVAHAMYEKLGYADFMERSTAHNILKTRKSKFKPSKTTRELDLDKILKIYRKCTKLKVGFVIRDKAYLEMIRKFESLSGKNCIIDKNGYVIFQTNVGGSWIQGTYVRELVALNTETMNKLIGLVEEKAKNLIYDRAIFDDTVLQVYKSRGYMIQKRSHSVMMAKPLAHNTSIKQVYSDKFYLTSLDFF